jgi:excisionase family DNA binding protein
MYILRLVVLNSAEKTMIVTRGHENKLLQKMLTVKEVACILSIHPNTIRRWQGKGLLKSYAIGPRHNLRFRQEDILDFLEKSRNGSATPS